MGSPSSDGFPEKRGAAEDGCKSFAPKYGGIPFASSIDVDDVVTADRRITTPDRVLLEGPHSRRRELSLVLRAALDFIRGFRVLHFVGPCVTVFGSARFSDGHPYYALAREVGRGVAELGFTVMTGGGPGLMEAANRGAKDAGGRSVGCNITLPAEQQVNPYVDRSVTCRHFFVRKVLLFKYSYAFVAMPGGVGTMDELFEAFTLIQTGKIEQFPMVLMGTSYWRPLTDLLDEMTRTGAMSQADRDLLFVTDSVAEAMAHLRRSAIEKFALRAVPAPQGWLGEQPFTTSPAPASAGSRDRA